MCVWLYIYMYNCIYVCVVIIRWGPSQVVMYGHPLSVCIQYLMVIVGNMVESPSVGRETEQLRGLIKDLLVNSSQLSASRILDLLWFTMIYYVSLCFSFTVAEVVDFPGIPCSHIFLTLSHIQYIHIIVSYRIVVFIYFFARPAATRLPEIEGTLRAPCLIWLGPPPDTGYGMERATGVRLRSLSWLAGRSLHVQHLKKRNKMNMPENDVSWPELEYEITMHPLSTTLAAMSHWHHWHKHV